MYEFGKIVLIPFPFTDLTSSKLRPALILSRTNKAAEDIVVCFITSILPKKTEKSHFLLKNKDKHFKQTGLKRDSLFRFDKIATISKKLVLGELGSVSVETLRSMKKYFKSAFGF